MKKRLVNVAATLVLAPGFAEATFTDEIMDSQCAKGGGHASMFKKMGTNDAKGANLS